MTEKDFLNILQKYRKGECSEEERDLIDHWYENINLTDHSKLTDREKELENQYMDALRSHVHADASEAPDRKHRTLQYYILRGVAASVGILAVTFGSFLFRQDPPVARPAPASEISSWTLLKNSDQTQKLIELEDGSRITLQPNTQLKISSCFNQHTREVELDGDAFFDIAHNAEKPFIVLTDKVIAKVLGTSFTIKAFSNNNEIVVAVKTGKVSVYQKDNQEVASRDTSIVLTPNQQIVYNRVQKRAVPGLVSDPTPVIQDKEFERMHFEDVRVTEVLETFSKVYGIEISYDKEDFKYCTVTTSIAGNDLYHRLNIICKVIGATYKVDGLKIIIEGSGCAPANTETK